VYLILFKEAVSCSPI